MSGSTGTGVSTGARRRPAPALTPYVRWYEGYRLAGFPPGLHLGMPAPEITVILTLGRPVEVGWADGTPPDCFDALVGGLSTAAVPILHDGNQYGIQLALTPEGARVLLGVPTAALGSWAVDLGDVIGVDSREWSGRIAETDSWEERFDVLDRILLRRIASSRRAGLDPQLVHAWDLLVSDPRRVVSEVARDLGWSRRHLASRFASEFGVSPKDVARVARFDRSRRMLRTGPSSRVADVAVACGYYDQAHLARDWRDIAGVPPSRWLQDEVFPFVQDG